MAPQGVHSIDHMVDFGIGRSLRSASLSTNKGGNPDPPCKFRELLS